MGAVEGFPSSLQATPFHLDPRALTQGGDQLVARQLLGPLGAALGIVMFLNVWLVIWPKQQIVIASAEKVAAGGEADPAAAGALAQAGLASRTNTLFSIPMLFFMASSIHLAQLSTPVMSASILSLIVVFGIILALEINGLKGKTGPMTSVKGVVHMGFLLTLVLYLGVDLL